MTTTMITHSDSNQFQTLSTSQKWGGLIATSFGKRMKISIYSLFDYISTVASPMYRLQVFISFWRMLQIVGPSFLANCQDFWKKDSIIGLFLNYVSILYTILPVNTRPYATPIFCWVYFGCMLLFLLVVLISANSFRKKQKLSRKISNFVQFFVSGFGFIGTNAFMYNAAELIGFMIMQPSKYVNAYNLLPLVFGVIVCLIYMIIYIKVIVTTITFKATSLLSVVPTIQAGITTASVLIIFFLAIITSFPKIPRIALMVVAAIFYYSSITILFIDGGFVKELTEKTMGAALSASGTNIVLLVILYACGVHPSEYIIVVYVLIYIFSFLIMSFLLRKHFNSAIQKLDLIMEDQDNFELIKSEKQFADAIVIGYRYSHPICLCLKIFKLGVTKFPNSSMVWLVFGKFTAIYPELSQQLNFIAINLQSDPIKRKRLKFVLQQITFLLNQREGNLIPKIKLHLDKINKSVSQTKHKMRYLWDLIIQGNINDLDAAISSASSSIDKNEIEFLHMIQQYPNNRFVARSYARFLRDVKADVTEYRKWCMNCSLLSRGIKISEDLAHELAMKAFPTLPKIVDSDLTNNLSTAGTEESAIFEMTIDEEDKLAKDQEMNDSIKSSIDSLRIPAFIYARGITLFLVFGLLLIPLIGISVYGLFLFKSYKPAFDFIYTICLIRMRISQILAFIHRLLVENISVNLPSGKRIFPLENYTQLLPPDLPPPQSLGGTWETKKQISFILSDLVDLEGKLKGLMNYDDTSESIKTVKDYVFGQRINFSFYSDPIYDNPTNPTSVSYVITPKMSNVQQVISETIISTLALINKSTYSSSDYNYKLVNELFASTLSIQVITGNASSAMISFIEGNNNRISKLADQAMIAGSIIFAIIYLGITVSYVKYIRYDKKIIFRSLCSLPKNVVSKVSDSFKVLKKEDSTLESHKTDDEYSKQEENILKIFSSAGSVNTAVKDLIMGLVLTFIQIFFHDVSFCVALHFLHVTGDMIAKSAPNVNYITASYSVDITTVTLVTAILGYEYPGNLYHIPPTIEEIYSDVDYYTSRLSYYFQSMRYGQPETGDVPFAALGVSFSEKSATIYCNNEFPQTEYQIYECSNSDALISYIQAVDRLSKNLKEYGNKFYDYNDHNQKFIWFLHLYHIYDQYFAPMFEDVVGEVYKVMSRETNRYMGIIWGIFALAVLAECVLLLVAKKTESRQVFALKLILYCPGSAVLANSHISAILSGDISDTNIDITTRASDFYDQIVDEFPDAVIILDLEGKILQVNKVALDIFSMKKAEAIGKNIESYGEIFEGENPFSSLKTLEKQCCFDKNGSKCYFEVYVLTQQENTIITVRDITQKVMYDKLILDEKLKSDSLLSSILPASLVKRVQNGEKNISFAVQSASIIFMDIVSFTPWCGSLPASKVMTTLNALFRKIDALVALHPTITKIKCIGDCYMAAGGIFAEISQPAVHARDVLEFGMDSLDAIVQLNEEINENLKMRVGINTGGPIVAGVLGTAKPTFEIIGPAINMAQQMEHHGVPMQIHISRSVYELIYGSKYKVKERGEIEMKNCQRVITYIVEPRSSTSES